jgi:hypothetical protein
MRMTTDTATHLFCLSAFALLLSTCATNNPVAPASPATPESPASLPAATRPEPALPVDLLQPAIQRMIAPQVGVPLKVLAVAGPVRGWLAVAVLPPYREFPTVVLFRLQDGSWSRVFEALTPGVRARPSNLLDLHTKGKALDYTVGDGEQRLTPEVIAKVLSLSSSKKLAIVAHAYFFHSHEAGAENYFVDRTATYDLARRLFPGEYEMYPRTECTMFDVPAVRQIDFGSKGERLLLTVRTDNGQTWLIGWNGVDDRGLLTGKTVDAK